jgi:hypothetical protein
VAVAEEARSEKFDDSEAIILPEIAPECRSTLQDRFYRAQYRGKGGSHVDPVAV